MDDHNQRLLAELQEQNATLRRQMIELQRSHHLLQAVVDGTTDAVFVKDLRGRYLLANTAALHFVDKSIEEVLGHDDTRFFSAETARQIMECDRRIMECGQTQTSEEVGTAAGQTRTYLSTKGPYRDDRGRVMGIIGVSRDITERKRLDQQLAERERHLRVILDSEPECVKTLAADGTLLEMNRAGLKLIEADTPEQVCGLCIYPLVNAEYRPAFQALTEGVFRGESGILEFEGVGLKGHRLWLETHATPLRDESGRVTSASSITRDITERKRAELQLRDSERRFATLFRVSPVGKCITRFADGVFLDMNESFAKITGYTREELLGHSSLELNFWLDPEDRAKLVQALADIGFVRDWEVGFRRKDGSIGHSLRSLERLTLDGEDCILTALTDITERKRMEQELQHSAASLVAAQERAKMGSWELDLATQTGWWSQGMFLLFDRDPAAGPPTFAEFLTFIHPDDVSGLLQTHQHMIDTGEPANNDFRSNPARGPLRHFNFAAQPECDSQGQAVRLAGSVLDITERQQANVELNASRERLEILSRQLIATQETERRYIARELHDQIGQSLTAIKLNLNAVQSAAPETPSLTILHETIAVVDQTLEQVRTLSLELRPSILDDLGLVSALRWYLDRQAGRAGFAAQFAAELSNGDVSKEIETTCFRVTQEIMTNIVRHAHARNVRVEVRRLETELELFVQDDGVGFDPTAARGNSMGLSGMRERVMIVGGRMEIQSAPSRGTEIRVRVPLLPTEPEESED